MENAKSHWESVYGKKSPTEVSWYQVRPEKSLEMMTRTGLGPEASFIDVGGGASTLVDHLLNQGFKRITVLDISRQALEAAKHRLGEKAKSITWVEADITQAALPHHSFDIWHDRAVFHFLTDSEARAKYKVQLANALKPNGFLIMATFALTGPPRCSGLEVMHYDAPSLEAEFGPEYELRATFSETHETPFHTQQDFVFCLFQRRKPSSSIKTI
ncbi:MAG: class I SAM-dependent methyltransferase [Candidatus Omnitrophica bacterium]|nr:class I SAM-dependent methyltransferase [Candidatus Omnitrophota bacterium]